MAAAPATLDPQVVHLQTQNRELVERTQHLEQALASANAIIVELQAVRRNKEASDMSLEHAKELLTRMKDGQEEFMQAFLRQKHDDLEAVEDMKRWVKIAWGVAAVALAIVGYKVLIK